MQKSAPDKSENKPTPVVAEATPTVVVTPLPPKPVSTRAKSTVNLSQIGKAQQTADKPREEINEKLATRPLTFEEVNMAWQKFAETRKTQVAEYNLLSHNFDVNDHIIKLHLTNPVEEPLLAGIKADLVAFLKEQLNAPVVVEGELMQQELKRIIYTNKDKFDHLAGKYPHLLELKERFGLDTDY